MPKCTKKNRRKILIWINYNFFFILLILLIVFITHKKFSSLPFIPHAISFVLVSQFDCFIQFADIVVITIVRYSVSVFDYLFKLVASKPTSIWTAEVKRSNENEWQMSIFHLTVVTSCYTLPLCSRRRQFTYFSFSSQLTKNFYVCSRMFARADIQLKCI